jgi:hypothetical protein
MGNGLWKRRSGGSGSDWMFGLEMIDWEIEGVF